MGKILAKTYLHWTEPRNVRRTREDIAVKSVSHARRLAYCLLVGGVLTAIPWCVAKLNPAKNAPPLQLLVPIAIGAGLFYVYVFPWLLRLTPFTIRITDQGIMWVNGNRGGTWKYDDIQACSIATEKIDGEMIRVLAVTRSHDKTTMLGIDDSISLEELINVLLEHGVCVDRK